jgi:hypothetical protein
MMNLRKAKQIIEDVSLVLRDENSANSRVCAEALDRVAMFLNSWTGMPFEEKMPMPRNTEFDSGFTCGCRKADHFDPNDYKKAPEDADEDFLNELRRG